MVHYTTKIEDVNPMLFEIKDKVDPFEWVNCFCIATLLDLKAGSTVEVPPNYDPIFGMGKEPERELISVLESIGYAFKKYPVLFVDPVLNNLIEDTTPDINNIHTPYPAYFINKRFAFKNKTIMGIVVYDVKELTYCMLLDKYKDPKYVKEIQETIFNMPGIDNDLPKISFDFVMIDNNKDGEISLIMAGSDEVFNPIPTLPKEGLELFKTVMAYAINVSNLIINKVDLDIPNNPKKDVRIVNHYPSYAPKGKKGNFSIIRVFGNLKDYTQEYNKVKRKHGNRLKDTILVRGHWRNFKHEKYAKSGKQGTTIWIMPFVKGEDELHRRLIKLQGNSDEEIRGKHDFNARKNTKW